MNALVRLFRQFYRLFVRPSRGLRGFFALSAPVNAQRFDRFDAKKKLKV
jgi:hypothetical protein